MSDEATGAGVDEAGGATGAGSNTIATRAASGMSGGAIRLGSASVNAITHAVCARTDSAIGTADERVARSCNNRCRSEAGNPVPRNSAGCASDRHPASARAA
ncbi:MAG TPA: hypothetical protein VFE41_29050 [Acetobacteraceae bacterium]|jgi:hypothetical protein|nr:hypothetical protein [Acetobacteraceae bacterium]